MARILFRPEWSERGIARFSFPNLDTVTVVLELVRLARELFFTRNQDSEDEMYCLVFS